MEFEPIILDEKFKGREKALENIDRYIHFITPTMYYRTNDLIHSRRVLWHLEEAIPKIRSVYGTFGEGDFDSESINFARTLALVHDDAEIFSGDIQLYDKERMDAKEKEELEEKESDAIFKTMKEYGINANGFMYDELLYAAKDKLTLEAQFVSFFDKFDGGGEAWHEVWAGNNCFLLPAGGHQGEQGGYVRRLNEFPKKYPLMKKFFDKFPEYLPKPYNFKAVAKRGRPHEESRLKRVSRYPPYERWRKTIMKNEGTELLITQKEFPKNTS